MGKDVLDQVVAVLVARNLDERNPRPINPTLANTIKVPAKELGTANLQAFLDDLGGKLINAVLCGIPNDVVDGPAAVSWGTMLTDMLDAPVAELTVSNNVDVGQNLFDARALHVLSKYSLWTDLRR